MIKLSTAPPPFHSSPTTPPSVGQYPRSTLYNLLQQLPYRTRSSTSTSTDSLNLSDTVYQIKRTSCGFGEHQSPETKDTAYRVTPLISLTCREPLQVIDSTRTLSDCALRTRLRAPIPYTNLLQQCRPTTPPLPMNPPLGIGGTLLHHRPSVTSLAVVLHARTALLADLPLRSLVLSLQLQHKTNAGVCQSLLSAYLALPRIRHRPSHSVVDVAVSQLRTPTLSMRMP